MIINKYFDFLICISLKYSFIVIFNKKCRSQNSKKAYKIILNHELTANQYIYLLLLLLLSFYFQESYAKGFFVHLLSG